MREYGITTSKANYWLHVCPEDASFYIYPRVKMLEIMAQFKAIEIETAKGFLVPVIQNIRHNGGIIRALDFAYSDFKKWDWKREGATDAEIGRMGEDCVKDFAARGYLTLPVLVRFLDQKADQYEGKDIACKLPKQEVSVEIKTDLPGGIWGTSNLFVQTHEKPHKRAGAHVATRNAVQDKSAHALEAGR